MRVVAFMPVYNEADILASSIDALARDGVQVYVLDNWSDDGSYEIAREADVTVERFPVEPSRFYEARKIHERIAQLASEVDADWFAHVDADERRHPPWPDVTLSEAFERVDREGYTCVDHTVLEFHPVDEGFRGGDPEAYFRFYTLPQRPGALIQVRAWKNVGSVERVSSMGHDTIFDGRRVYPVKFLNKHYPIRSTAHGQRKVIQERLPRFSPDELAQGFHHHYNQFQPDGFIRSPAELLEFRKDDFLHPVATESRAAL